MSAPTSSKAFVFLLLCVGILPGALAQRLSSSGLDASGSNANSDNAGRSFGHEREALDGDTGLQGKSWQGVPALNGTGLLNLDEVAKPTLIYGIGASTGWDSNPAQLTTKVQGSGVIALNPYVGVQGTHRTTQFVIQYAPTFTRYTSSGFGSGWLQTGSAWLQSSINERWNWNLSASASYGQDDLRLLAPVATVAVGSVAGLGSGAAAYQPKAGSGVFLNSNVGVTFHRSDRDSLLFSVGNALSGFQSLGGDSGLVSTRVDYVRRLSPKLNLTSYGQLLSGYGVTPCESLGGGLGATWHIHGRSSLEVDGGPLFTVAKCAASQNFTFNAAFATKLTNLSEFYLRADRQYGAGYLGPGLWQDSAAAGYERQIAPGTVSLNAGYTGSSGLINGTSYRGIFLGGSYGRQLGRGLDPSVSYRRIMTNAGDLGFNRQIIIFSLTWNSAGLTSVK